MSMDELRDALDRAADGPERDFTGVWGAGRAMRRRRQTAQGLGGLALAAVVAGAVALGGGDLMKGETMPPATPTVPDDVVVTSVQTDSEDAVVTTAEPTPSTDVEEASEVAGSSTATPPVTASPTSDLIVVPNPCDQPSTGLTVMAGGATPSELDRAQQLLDLASSCDLDGLIALAEEQGTFLSFGGTSPADAFAGEEGRARAHALVALLANFEPVIGGGNDGPLDAAMWPQIPQERWDELVELGIYTQEHVDLFRAEGNYVGWRIYIEPDGNWSGMVAGD